MTFSKFKYGVSVAAIALALSAGATNNTYAAEETITNGGNTGGVDGGVGATLDDTDTIVYADNSGNATPLIFTFDSSVALGDAANVSIDGAEGPSASTNADVVTFNIGVDANAVAVSMTGAVVADGSVAGDEPDTINFTFEGTGAHTLTLGDDTEAHRLGASGVITMANAGDVTTVNGASISLGSTQFDADSELVLNVSGYNGDIDSGAPGNGTVTVAGTTTIAGTIGASNAIGELDVTGGGAVELSGTTINIQVLDLDGAGTTTFSGGAAAITVATGADLTTGHTLALDGANASYTGDIDSSDNSGILDINGANITVFGDVGSNNNLATVTVDTAGSVEFQGTVNADDITLEGSGALTLGAGSSVVSANGIEDTDGNGAVTVDGDGTVSFNGNIGGTNGIASLDITTADTLNFTGAGTIIDATNITLDGTLQVSASAATTIIGDIASTGGSAGNLNIDVDTIFDGTVGSGNSIATMDVATSVYAEFGAAATAIEIDSVTLNGTGRIVFAGGAAQAFTGDVASAAGGTGLVTVDSDLTFTGNIGTAVAGEEVTSVTVGATDTDASFDMDGDIYATNVLLGGTSTLTLQSDGNTVTGNVIGGADGEGTFRTGSNAGTYTITGNAGTAPASLGLIDVQATDTLIVGGSTVDATAITVDGELNLTGATVSVTGAVDSTGGSAGVLDLDGDVTFVGNVGGNNSIATMEVADTFTATLSGTVNNIDNVTLQGATGSVLQFTGAGSTFTGAIDSDGSAAGSLDLDTVVVFGAGSTVGAVNGITGISVANAADMDVRTAGTFNAGAITLEGTGELIIGASNVDVNATSIDSDGAGTGVISVGAGFSGTVLAGTVGGTNGIATISIGAGSDFEMSGTTINATTLTMADTNAAVRFSGNGAAIGIANLDGGNAVFDGGGTQTFTGVIGNGTALDLLEVSNNTTLAVSANVSTSNIQIEDGSTLQVTGTTTLVGDIDSTAVNTLGVLDLDGDVTIAGDIGTNELIGTLDIDAAGSLITGGNTIDASAFNVNGTLSMDDSVVLGGSTVMTIADGSTITLTGTTLAATNAETTNSTYIDADTNNATVILPNGTVAVNFATGYTGTVDLVDADGGTLTDNGVTFDTSNAGTLVNVDFIIVTDERVTMSVVEKSNAQLAGDIDVSEGEADALFAADDAITTGSDATARTALDAAISAGGNSAKRAAQQSGVDVQSTFATTAMTSNISRLSTQTSTRLSATRAANISTNINAAMFGASSGNGIMRDGFWFQGFAQTAEQDERGGVDGFESETFGGTMGFDRQVTVNSRVGVALGYANTEVDGDSLALNGTEIDSYQVSLYGDYTKGNYFLEGMVGYTFNDAETTQVINFGGLDRSLAGDFDAGQYSASVKAGFSKALTKNVTLVPSAGLLYTFVEGDEFRLTDSSGGGFTQDVDIDDTHVLIGSVGASLQSEMVARNGATWLPEVHANFMYDFIGDEAQATSTFTGTGVSYSTEGADIAEASVNLGTGVTYTVPNKMMDFTASYDAELKEDFSSHTGVLKARFKF
ncbi:MAG: hypothetical protein CMP22_08130 [Rickettsiales bacterium]|nr:hypothetical protein [Rickettsiales bacterium]